MVGRPIDFGVGGQILMGGEPPARSQRSSRLRVGDVDSRIDSRFRCITAKDRIQRP